MKKSLDIESNSSIESRHDRKSINSWQSSKSCQNVDSKEYEPYTESKQNIESSKDTESNKYMEYKQNVEYIESKQDGEVRESKPYTESKQNIDSKEYKQDIESTKYTESNKTAKGLRQSRFYKILCWFITFNFINITWVFFRAENLQGAFNLLKGMFGIAWVELSHNARLIPHFLAAIQGRNDTLIYIILAFIICLSFKNSFSYVKQFRLNIFTFVATMLILYTAIISICIKPYEPFLYFNF